MNRLLTPSGLPLYSEQDFIKHAQAKDLPSELAVVKGFVSTVKATKDSNRFKFTISTAGVDRDKDVISVDGWQLDSYKQNPVVLFGHDYHSLPVGKSVSITSTKKSLNAEVEFASAEVYPFAETVRRMVAGGFLSAASVGFKPLKYMYNEERRGVDIEGSELLEWSIVPVPANAECLVQLSAALTPEMLAEFAGPCEKFLETCKGKGMWVVETEMKAEKAAPALDIAALAIEVKRLIMPEPKSLAGCKREGGCPTNEDGSAENCTMADCPMKAVAPVGAASDEPEVIKGEIVFEDEGDYVFGITPEGVRKIAGDATREAMKQYVNQLIKEQIDYARGRITE